MRRLARVCQLGLILLSLVAPWSARGWDVRIDGTGNVADEAEALAIDANGDVIAAGRLYDATRFYDFVVVKRNGVTGNPVWQRTAYGNGGAGCCGTDEGAHAVAVDAFGIVFAAGHLEYDPAARGQDLAVIRFEPGGELWRSLLDGGRSLATTDDLALDVALDPDGNVVSAGRLTAFALTPLGRVSEFTVTKLAAASGAPFWTRRIQGSEVDDGGSTNSARTITTDASGDVIAAGSLLNAVGQEFVVMKLAAATGMELWRRELGAGQAFSVAVDSAGHVIAAGERSGAYVIKLDGATGGTLWDQEFPDRIATDIALDSDGNAIAVGQSAADAGMFAVKLASDTGMEHWPPFLLTGTAGGGAARDVAIDASGDILIGGYLGNTATSHDFTVVKLAGATGLELWRREIDGGLASQDEANAIAVDTEGHVVAAGRVDDPVGRIRFTIMKLRRGDGADLAPCGDVDDDLDVDVSDLAALRAYLAGAPPGLVAPEKCSVFGGADDCDLVDQVVLLRWLSRQTPQVASVCAAVVQ